MNFNLNITTPYASFDFVKIIEYFEFLLNQEAKCEHSGLFLALVSNQGQYLLHGMKEQQLGFICLTLHFMRKLNGLVNSGDFLLEYPSLLQIFLGPDRMKVDGYQIHFKLYLDYLGFYFSFLIETKPISFLYYIKFTLLI